MPNVLDKKSHYTAYPENIRRTIKQALNKTVEKFSHKTLLIDHNHPDENFY